MGYTAAPNKCTLYGEQVYEKDGYIVQLASGRLYLYKNEYKLAELVSGYDTLKKSYRNSFDMWIGKVRDKDLAKIDTIREQMEAMENDCKLIAEIHNFKE